VWQRMGIMWSLRWFLGRLSPAGKLFRKCWITVPIFRITLTTSN
jgi:hypothetical protein